MQEENKLLCEKLSRIETKLNSFEDEFIPLKEKILKRSKEINEVLPKIHNSWSGSPLGYHHNLYYKDFEEPSSSNRFNIEWGGIYGIPEGWGSKNYEDIVEEVFEQSPGITVDDMEEQIEPIVERAKDLSLEVVTSLSFIKHYSNSEDEVELLKDVEPENWEISYDTFLRRKIQNRNFFTRDSSAVTEGLKYPPHFRFEAQLESLVSPLFIIDKFLKKVRRLLMQIKANLKHYTKEVDGIKGQNLNDGVNIFNSNVGAIQTGEKSLIQDSNLLSDINCDNSDTVVKLFEELLMSIKKESALSNAEKEEATETVGKVVDELSKETEKQDESKISFLFNKLNWVLTKAPVVITIIEKIQEYIN